MMKNAFVLFVRETCPERLEFQWGNCDGVLWSRIGPATNFIDKCPEGADAHLLDSLEFPGKVGILLGVARNMTAIGPQYIRAEQILAVAARAGAHGDQE